MRDDQFQVSVSKAKKTPLVKKEPVGFYIGQTGHKKTTETGLVRPKAQRFKALKKKLSIRISALKKLRFKKSGLVLKEAQMSAQKPKKAVPKKVIGGSINRTTFASTKPHKVKKRKITKEHVIFVSVAFLGIVMGLTGILVRQYAGHSSRQTSKDKVTAKTAQAKTAVLGAASTGTPDFATVKPSSSVPVQMSFDSERQIAVFRDTFGGNDITITQQPYPEKLKNTANGLEALAKSLNDFSKLDTFSTSSKGMVYMATLKSGKQTLIFVVGDVMVFLNSSNTLAEEQWVVYIESLK